jgi:transcriptional regulator with XRE-family HTH domain
MNTLAERMASKMTELNLTQATLAERIHISQAAVQKITAGKTRHPRRILEIARQLKVSPEWLMFGDDNTQHGN